MLSYVIAERVEHYFVLRERPDAVLRRAESATDELLFSVYRRFIL